jgi:hypothetical protein
MNGARNCPSSISSGKAIESYGRMLCSWGLPKFDRKKRKMEDGSNEIQLCQVDIPVRRGTLSF